MLNSEVEKILKKIKNTTQQFKTDKRYFRRYTTTNKVRLLFSAFDLFISF